MNRLRRRLSIWLALLPVAGLGSSLIRIDDEYVIVDGWVMKASELAMLSRNV